MTRARTKTFSHFSSLLIALISACGSSDTDHGVTVDSRISVPSNLTASMPDNLHVELTWADRSAEEGGFEIERASNSTDVFATLTMVDANVTTFTDEDLDGGETYRYRVRAFQGENVSQYSNVVEIEVPFIPPVPEAPIHVQALGTGPTTVSVTWTDISDVEDLYEVVRYDNEFHVGIPVIASVSENLESYDDTGLESGTTYYYFVRACNIAGCGSSSEATATVGDFSGYIIKPDNLVAATISHTQIDLQWDDLSDNELGFQIERSPDASAWEAIGSVAADEISFSDTTNLIPETTYYYRVRAYNVDFLSGYSNVAEGSTGSLPNIIPVAPSDLVAVAASAIQVNLTWSDNANNESGFHVYSADSSEGPWTRLTQYYRSGVGIIASPLPPNSESFSQGFLSAPVSAIYYKVVAFNSEGTSESNIAVVTTPPVPTSPPAAPTSFTVTALPDLRISASWHDNATNEYHYIVQRAPSSSGPWSNCFAYSGQGAAANRTTYEGGCGLTANSTYSFRVYASNPAGNTYSNIVNGITALP